MIRLIHICTMECNYFFLLIQGKLDDYQERMNKGERLNQDQLVMMLHFIRDFFFVFLIRKLILWVSIFLVK